MARSDGYGTRPGHPAPVRSGHQLDQPAQHHHGEQPGGWQDGDGYPQESYWQQPAAPEGYDPVAPAHPLSAALGGLAQRLEGQLRDPHSLEPVAPDPRYAGAPPADPYGAADPYHFPHAPGFDPYEPSQPHLNMPGQGHDFGHHPDQGANFAAPDFPRFSEPVADNYAPQHSFAPEDGYVPSQYEPSYPPENEPHPQHAREPAAYQPYPSAEAQADDRYGQFHDYLPVAPPRGEPPLSPAYPEAQPHGHHGDHGQYERELPELRGAEFEDWPRADNASDQAYQSYAEAPVSPATGHGGYAEPGWPKENAFTPDSGPIFASAGYDLSQELAVHPEYDEEEEYYEEEETEERRRSFPIGLISLALAGVVMVGGGMAYGYKVLLGPTAEISGTPVVKSASQPPKIRPEEPGGRNFDHTDSKILGRLSEQRNAASAQGQKADDGSRRVSTVVIGRNGDIVAPVDAPTPSAEPPANPVVTVPGLTIVDGFGGRAPSANAAPQRPIVVQPPEANAPRSPARPVSVARAEPASFGAAEAAAPARAVEPVRRPATNTVAPAPPKASPPVTTASTAAAQASNNGYVAVLASVPVSSTSRMEALAQFADIQQNYGSVLGSRTPDVREANLGSRGRFHRLMVGPPGSKEGAAQLCSQLKSVGYSGCWITTY